MRYAPCELVPYNDRSEAKMKINIQSPYNPYKGKLPEIGKAAHASEHAPGAEQVKTDRDSITRGSTAVADKHLLALKSGVQSYVSAPADPERLASIRDGVLSGTYRIPTEDLVNAVMLDE